MDTAIVKLGSGDLIQELIRRYEGRQHIENMAGRFVHATDKILADLRILQLEMREQGDA